MGGNFEEQVGPTSASAFEVGPTWASLSRLCVTWEGRGTILLE